MKTIRRLMPLLSLFLIIPLAWSVLGPGGAAGAVPAQGQVSAAVRSSVAPSSVAPSGDPQRIQFQPGTTMATVQGSLAPNASGAYVLQAAAGQTLTVHLSSTQGQVVMTIVGADGTPLVTDYVGNSSFSGVLPTSQDYTITLQASGQVTVPYALEVSIPPLSSGPTPPAGALPIQFAPGTTSATVQGTLPANGSQQYLVRVAAGQLMQVDLGPLQQGIQMSVRGVDGTVLKSSAGNAFFRGDVPSTQNYVITLSGATTATAYTLTVTIPVRISFAAGATSATVQDKLPAFTTGHYVIQALGGQKMTIQTTASQGQVIVIVYGADGDVLQSDHAGASGFSGTLPSSQDYLIDLRSVGQTAAMFSMTVTIPPLGTGTPPPAAAKRILFASGATSATVQGTLPANGSQQYLVRVAAGQLMQVDLGPLQQGVQMSVKGADGTVLKSSAGNAFFRGDVPSSQDYIITLSGATTATNYTLTVTIPIRISFAEGATSATVQGNVPVNSIGHYVLRALGGQTMTIKTNTYQGQIVLIIYGADGTVLISDHAGATSFSGTLPSSQDYLIDVEAVGQTAAMFSMTVTIPPR